MALPAFTCFEVAAAAVRTGARLALYDIDPHTLAPDLQSLEEVVRAGARIVVVSPLYGIPIDWTQVEARLAPYGAVAIEDAAQGHGAYWRGRPLGSWGRLSVLSFGRGKGWTGVRGGALLLRDGMTAETPPECSFAYEIRVLCLAAAQGALARPSLYGLPASLPWLRLGETHYREASTPRRMARAAAAILESTREAAEREAIARRESARALLDALPCGPVVWPVKPHEPGSVAGFVRLPIRLIGGSNGLLDTATATRLGLRGTYPSTLAELPAVRGRLSPVPSRWSGAQTLVRQLMTLPTHSLITSEEQDEIVRIISRCTP